VNQVAVEGMLSGRLIGEALINDGLSDMMIFIKGPVTEGVW